MADTMNTMVVGGNADINLFQQIISTNLIYQQYKPRWNYYLESYLGGETYRQGGHLVHYENESSTEYEARLNATPLDNHVKGVVSIYNSFLFRNKADRNFGSLANLPELEEFIDDVDFDGRCIDDFMKDVSTWACVFGHCWLLVSKPNINATTKADEIMNGIRPYLSVLSPIVVLDWDWKRQPNGRYELTYFKYVEEINGNEQTIKTWTKDEVTTSIIDLKDRIVKQVVPEKNGLGCIPAVLAFSQRSIVRGIGTSPISDIADAQKFIYNATSEVDQSIRLNSHPSLVKTTETAAGAGAGAIIQMPDNLDPQLKPYVLQFAGQDISNTFVAITNTIESIEKMANIGTVRSSQTRTMSGVAMETEFALLNARLNEMADNLELAEDQMWCFWAMYQGYQWDGEIDYPEEFNIRDKSGEIDRIKKAFDCAPTDPRVIQQLNAQLMEYIDPDYDELTWAADTTISTPDAVDEPGELPTPMVGAFPLTDDDEE